MDLSDLDNCKKATEAVDVVYNLAADMGGMGFIEAHKAECMLSVLINTHLLLAAKEQSVERFFFASSACVYSAGKQLQPDIAPLKEDDAYPAMPEDGYGWEKLFSERMSRHFREDFGLKTRIARFHNVYGPNGTYDGGREKAPAAVCRKVAQAKISGDHRINIWGDGHQTRSFMYIDDCVKGTQMILDQDFFEPINLGSEEMVSINQLISYVAEISGKRVIKKHKLDAPVGVRGRNSSNVLIRKVLDWDYQMSLKQGLKKTYAWINEKANS
jgi:nucleoside-diphosphate-sugar epimerase